MACELVVVKSQRDGFDYVYISASLARLVGALGFSSQCREFELPRIGFGFEGVCLEVTSP